MFFPKRQQCFEEVLCRTLPESNKKKLVDLCRTRWVARNDALSVFLKLYPAVVETLTIISSSRGWNADSASRARQQCFEEVLCRTLPESNKKKLVDLCPTRWVARNDALSVFLKLYPAVVETLTIISSSRGWNADSASRARSFLNSITSSFPPSL